MSENTELEQTIETIVENITFQKKQLFEQLLRKSIHVSNDSTKSTYAEHENMAFKMDTFFKGFPTFINEHGKDKKYEAGVEALSLICNALGIDIEKEECFILFHIRDLGKFRMKESKLHDELKPLWRQYKEYALGDQDFSYALKNLMRMKLINYRRGNLHLNPTVIIRYRTHGRR